MTTLWAMRLRHGATVGQAIQALDGIIQESLQTRNIARQAFDVKLNSYLNWVYGAQTRLRSIFADTELEDSLLARAYWHVSMASGPVGLCPGADGVRPGPGGPGGAAAPVAVRGVPGDACAAGCAAAAAPDG